MGKRIHKIDISDPKLLEKLDAIKQELLAASPEHIQKLGKILRAKSLFRLKRFLKKYGYAGKIAPGDLPLFMDYLITQRIDLKDMEPGARKNLRAYSLRNEPDAEKTDDYKEYVEGQSDPLTCKDCRWFMEVPPDEDKHCVALGAKGIDAPCYGFTKKLLV